MDNREDDIEKYLSGKLSPEEMHALEKKALDDPFLYEALEGATSIGDEDFSKDVSALNSTIRNRKKQITPVTLWTWPLRIAAGLVLLAVSTYVVFTLTDSTETKKDSIALNKEMQEAPQESITKKSDSVILENLAPEKTIESDQTEKNLPKIPLAEESKAVERKSEASNSPVESDETVEAITSADNVDEVIITEPGVTPDRAAENENYSLQQSELKKKSIAGETNRQRRGEAQPVPSAASGIAVNSKKIKGKVTDVDDGLPLPGVNVLVKDSKIGTTTDLNGNFEINVPDTQNNLVFSFIGMESKEITVASNDKPTQISVQLAPDVSELSEVVVTGYGTGEEQEYEGTKWELTEPVGGKKAYKNYLETNLRYPEVALENNIQGKVTIQFTVEPSGQLTDFRIVKSLGSQCDEELIRLIKSGPKWTATKRNDEPVKSKAKVKMRFSLPKKK